MRDRESERESQRHTARDSMPTKKKGETENVRVVVRLRPLYQAELAVDQGEVVRVGADRRSIQVLLPAEQDFAGNTRNTMKKFELDGCFGPGHDAGAGV